MAAWPLPHFPRLEHEIAPQDGRVRTPTSTGPVKMRRRYTAVVRDWPATEIGPINGVELAALDYFYTTTTAQGTAAFTWVDETGSSKSFRFAAPPRYRCTVGHHVPGLRKYMVSVALEQLVS